MTKVKGVLELQAVLVKHKHKTGGRLARGLLKAGLFLQRESMKLVPVDTSALRATARTRKEGSGIDIEVIVSYGTDYAVYVHEDLNAAHKPPTQAKFLEGPLRTHAATLATIIRTEMKKG